MDNEKLHNDEELWMKYEKDAMSDEERIAFLTQMLECEDDIEKLASLETAEMPDYLAEEILEHILPERNLEDDIVEKEPVRIITGTLYRWFRLFCYGAKVTIAAACAIVVLFNLPDLSKTKTRPEPVFHKKTSYVADTIDFITNKIFDGGIENDK